MRRTKYFLLAIVCLLLVMSCCLVGCRPGYKEIWEPVEVPTFNWVDNGDIEIIRRRIASDLYDENIDIENILSIAKSDGTFEGYDYFNDKRTNQWAPLEHLRNIKSMQIAYYSEGHKYYKSERIKQFVADGLSFWKQHNFYCKWSGWNNDIGMGLCVPDIFLLDEGEIDAGVRTFFIDRIKSTSMDNEKLRFRLYERTVNESGGNLTDQVQSTLKIACMGNDGSLIMWLTSLLENELRPFPPFNPEHHRWDAEGIKEDWSFQQHDQLVYFGGYGEVFLTGMNRYINYTRGTQFALSDDKLNFYADFVINGYSFCTRNGYRDISASGRGIARTNGLKGCYVQLKNTVNTLLMAVESGDVTLREDIVKTLRDMKVGRIDTVESGEMNDVGAGGHRYFYESDYNVYNDKKYMASVRHASDRTRVFEYLNYENKLGYYTGLGATFYYVDGDEYFNMPPIFDWNKIPGTTTRQGRVPTMGQDASYNRYGSTKYAMGVSNGKVGMSYFRMNSNAVGAKKAYFMFEDGVVCLGNDIVCGAPYDVITNVNQCNLSGDVIVSKNGKTTTNQSISGVVDYIYHDRIAYITDNAIDMTIDKGRTGNWNKVFTKSPDAPYTGDVFNVDINHGKWPRGKKYEYTVLMNTTPDETREYIAKPTLEVLANDKSVQAVADTEHNIIEGVFHDKGALILPNGDKMNVSEGCVFILEMSGGQRVLTIASHDYDTRDIDVTIGTASRTINIAKKPIKITL